MANSPIEGLMGVAMEHIKQMVDVNTIVGDPVQTPDGTTIIPISRVSFGFGAGGAEFSAKPMEPKNDNTLFGGGSGGGVSIHPVGFLVVSADQVRLIPVSNNMSTVDRLVDMVPDVLNKFNQFIQGKLKKDEDKAKPADTSGADMTAEKTDKTTIVLDD